MGLLTIALSICLIIAVDAQVSENINRTRHRRDFMDSLRTAWNDMVQTLSDAGDAVVNVFKPEQKHTPARVVTHLNFVTNQNVVTDTNVFRSSLRQTVKSVTPKKVKYFRQKVSKNQMQQRASSVTSQKGNVTQQRSVNVTSKKVIVTPKKVNAMQQNVQTVKPKVIVTQRSVFNITQQPKKVTPQGVNLSQLSFKNVTTQKTDVQQESAKNVTSQKIVYATLQNTDNVTPPLKA